MFWFLNLNFSQFEFLNIKCKPIKYLRQLRLYSFNFSQSKIFNYKIQILANLNS